MRVKPELVEIDDANIFKNDALERRNEIENLSRLISSLSSPFVLSLNSPWGTGKTTFTRLWAAHLQKAGKATIYFNAWETDFSDDPLLSFLGEIDEDFNKLAGGSPTSTAAWERAKIIGGKIAKRGLPAIIKVVTTGVLDASDLVEEQASNVFSDLSEDAVDAYLSQKNSIEDFKKSVATALSRLDDAGPIVIFVDELDRCRPNYAISLLERIKHLFDVQGIIFVLSVDIEQLSHSIEAIYGQNFDARGYLRRFIDIDYTLVVPKPKKFVQNLFAAYEMKGFFEGRRQSPSLRYEAEHLIDTFEVFSRWENLSLREIEQIFSRINLVLRATPSNSYLHPALVVFLVILKYRSPSLYKDYTSGSREAEPVLDYINRLVPHEEKVASFNAALVEGFLIAAGRPLAPGSENILQRYNAISIAEDSSEVEKEYAGRVVLVATKPIEGGRGNTIDIGSLISKIEMFAKFEFPEANDDQSSR